MEYIFLLLGIYFLVLGIINLNKNWYEKYIRFINQLQGQQTNITDMTYIGSKFFGAIYIIAGLSLITICILWIKGI